MKNIKYKFFLISLLIFFNFNFAYAQNDKKNNDVYEPKSPLEEKAELDKINAKNKIETKNNLNINLLENNSEKENASNKKEDAKKSFFKKKNTKNSNTDFIDLSSGLAIPSPENNSKDPMDANNFFANKSEDHPNKNKENDFFKKIKSMFQKEKAKTTNKVNNENELSSFELDDIQEIQEIETKKIAEPKSNFFKNIFKNKQSNSTQLVSNRVDNQDPFYDENTSFFYVDENTDKYKLRVMLDSINELIERGQNQNAKEALNRVKVSKTRPMVENEITFLKGMVAQNENNFKEAEKQFRKIINKDPSITRVRLELAKALFHQNKSKASSHHFKMALSDDLPPSAKNKIQSYLNEIDNRRWWHVTASASLTPDSNINSGTSNDSVDIWGIPFKLDKDAQKKSGFGITGSTSLVLAPKINDNLRWKSEFFTNYTHYDDDKYNVLRYNFDTGPVYYFNNSSIGISANYNNISIGGDEYSSNQGGRIFYNGFFAGIYSSGISFSFSDTEYEKNSLRNGTKTGLSLFIGRPFNKRIYGSFGLNILREDTKTEWLDNQSLQLYSRIISELPYGINLKLSPSFISREFDALDPTFDERRTDSSVSLDIAVIKRNWTFQGFVPEISYSYQKNDSNIDFYDFERQIGSIGITRDF